MIRRRLLRSLAFLAALLPGIAAAQLPYPNVPASTVVGRLGGPASGPSYAIPFSTLVSQIGAVPTTRIINTTAPLAGGGNLNTDLTLTFAAQAPNLIFAGPTSGGSAVPSFRAMVAADISASIVSNAKLANAPAYTLKGNATGSSATPTDIDVTALTLKASPAANDVVLIQDSAASFAYKKATVSSLGSPGAVSSIDSKTGAFTTNNGLDSTGGNVIELTAARRTLPTTQVLTASSGTYTTPANVLWIEVTMVGGGGGGGGSGSGAGTASAAGATCWNTSGAACTTPVYSAGGGGGGGGNGNAAGTGGSATGSGTFTWSVSGSGGAGGTSAISGTTGGVGGSGGASFYGGSGGGGATNVAGGGAGTNSGSGGGGAGLISTVSQNAGSGGGAGAVGYVIINSPAASYTFAVGSGSSGGSAGTSGQAGGTGGAGRIVIIEHYGT